MEDKKPRKLRTDRKEIPPDRFPEIGRMRGLGMTIKQIAHVFGMNEDTLELRIKENPELEAVMNMGVSAAHKQVTETAFAMATDGKNPAMTMFWLKCRAQWKDTQHVEMSGKIDLEKLVLGSIEPPDKNKPVIDVKKIERDTSDK